MIGFFIGGGWEGCNGDDRDDFVAEDEDDDDDGGDGIQNNLS